MTKPNKTAAEDPFKGLKHIAYCRTGIVPDMSMPVLVDYAKWQICKIRKVLWHDPIWNEYTEEEILIEFFCINFDLSPEARTDFERSVLKPQSKDLAWFTEMEKKYAKQPSVKVEETAVEPIIDKIEVEPVEFEDTFKWFVVSNNGN